MSILTTQPITWLPASANSFTLTNCANTPPDYGDWIEIIASAAADSALAAIGLIDLYSQSLLTFQIGIGGAGAEVAVGTFQIGGPNSGNSGGQGLYYFNAALDVINAGDRVSLRCRTSNVAGTSGAGDDIAVFVGYYSAPTLDHMTDVQRKILPNDANGATVTPNASSGVNSSYVEISAALPEDIWAVGLGIEPSNIAAITGYYEIDLATGGAGAEVVIATFTGWLGNGSIKNHDLPTLRFIASGTRVTVRLRKDGTSVADWGIVLNYHGPASSATNTLRVQKVTVPSGLATEFDFTTTGGLSPATFSLSHGEEQVFSGLADGVYGVSETAETNFDTDYDVSNSDPNTAIDLAGGETVTVIVTNTRIHNPGSGIYKIVPDKRNDTLYLTIDPITTEDVEIPRPFVKLPYVGE